MVLFLTARCMFCGRPRRLTARLFANAGEEVPVNSMCKPLQNRVDVMACLPCACLLQVQMLHVDAAVGPVSVMFSGAKEPIAAARQTAVFGKLAVARQVTAQPETYRRRLNVGRCRDVEIEVHSLYKVEPPVPKLHGKTVTISNRTSLSCDTIIFCTPAAPLLDFGYRSVLAECILAKPRR